MDELNKLVKSLTIGATDMLHSFRSIVSSKRLTGGISRYTVFHTVFNGLDLRSSNLANNFENGEKLRVKKEDIQPTNSYVYDDTGTLSTPYIPSDFIGSLYHQKDSVDNSNFRFGTPEGFTIFESAIRTGLLRYRKLGYEYGNNYWDIMNPNDILGNGVSPNGLGDEYNVSDNDFSFLENNVIKIDSYYVESRNNNLEKNKLLGLYRYNKPYAVGNESDKIDEYSYKAPIKGDYEAYKDIVVEHENDGSMMSSYYSEHDVGGSAKLDSYDMDYDINSLVNKKNQSKTFINIKDDADGYSNLIKRTNELFYNMKIGSLINRFHTSDAYDNDDMITAKSDYGMSRGRNLLSKGASLETGYFNPYCRVWTAHHRYGMLNRLIRPFMTDEGPVSVADVQNAIENGSNLRPGNGGTEHLANNTVLLDNGFVRIAPSHDEDFYGGDEEKMSNIKSYMFSIENLAWRNIELNGAKISKEQQGPNGGRIMWFPPYNLKFQENVDVEWNGNKFIGRGEQIYTYTNTDRKGTLSFTLLIDHPSLLNKWRGTSQTVDDVEMRENEVLRYFAGCEILNGTCGNGEKTETKKVTKNQTTPKYTGKTRKVALVLFFPNNFSGYDYREQSADVVVEKLREYENGPNPVFTEQDSDMINNYYPNDNNSLYNLNNNNISDINMGYVRDMLFNGDSDIEIYSFFHGKMGYDELNDNIVNIKSENGVIFGDKHKSIHIEKIDVYGYASSHGTVDNNRKLSKRRADFMKKAIISKSNEIDNSYFGSDKTGIKEVNDISPNTPQRDINLIDAKIGRSAVAVFTIKWDDDATTNSSAYVNGGYVVQNKNYDSFQGEESGNNENVVSVTSDSNEEYIYRADNEYLYFSNLERDDEVAFQTITEKIRYFNPAYHSITPEGFNARLTFLHQCTRQGPTVDLPSGRISGDTNNYVKYAGNLAFGRPPYCILRIGDFFHTKICITSMSIEYATDSGVQWDLNPEGIGVQPMFANINLSFNFIGGQDLSGPIERLQNAVTSNYYANASVYDHKADKDGYVYDVRLNIPEVVKGDNK